MFKSTIQVCLFSEKPALKVIFREALLATKLPYNLQILEDLNLYKQQIQKHPDSICFFDNDLLQNPNAIFYNNSLSKHILINFSADEAVGDWYDTVDEFCIKNGRIKRMLLQIAYTNSLVRKLTEAESELQKLKAISEAVTNLQGFIAFVLDHEFKLLYVNEEFIKIFRLNMNIEVKVGSNYLEIPFNTEQVKRIKEFTQIALKGKRHKTDNIYTSNAGKLDAYHTEFIPVYCNESIIGVAVVAQNITEHRLLKEGINNQIQEMVK